MKDSDMIPPPWDCCGGIDGFHSKLVKHRAFKQRFQPALDSLRENLPFWLKYFHEWKNIQPTRIATLLKEQFAINCLKDKLQDVEARRSKFYETIGDLRKDWLDRRDESKRKCQGSQDCKMNLDAHLKRCTNGCTEDYKAHTCFRCIHFLEQEYFDGKLEIFECYENDLEWEYVEIRHDLKRALRIQELGGAYNEEVHNDAYYDI